MFTYKDVKQILSEYHFRFVIRDDTVQILATKEWSVKEIQMILRKYGIEYFTGYGKLILCDIDDYYIPSLTPEEKKAFHKGGKD